MGKTGWPAQSQGRPAIRGEGKAFARLATGTHLSYFGSRPAAEQHHHYTYFLKQSEAASGQRTTAGIRQYARLK